MLLKLTDFFKIQLILSEKCVIIYSQSFKQIFQKQTLNKRITAKNCLDVLNLRIYSERLL